MKHLLLGGARSGKSCLAECRALETRLPVTYIATATAGDDEMAERIAHHRAGRPEGWDTVEVPLQLGAAIAEFAAPGRCLLVDCLTLWLSNALAEGDAVLAQERASLLAALAAAPGEILLVANEVGLGIVPDNVLARRFRDEAGRLNQDAAALCEQVTFVAAGLPLVLKAPTT